ncbi:MAG: DUF4055 domain-containing protein [Gammaproteobacteria bacterium]|nr:DUF4055 domain-containing protein [Gammaproteobacteria bacterium]MCP5013829.1 DUF4055 domain-containing protein [Ketobacter sp.]
MTAMHDVTFEREEYKRNVKRWQLVEDCTEGQAAVKSRKEVYLPRPNPGDKSTKANERYAGYCERAVFYNATGRTLEGMVGLAFQKVPALERHDDVDYVEDDIDGKGLSIYQHSQQTLEAVLKTGFYGLLADYPRVGGPVSKADAEKNAIRATVAAYPAKSIINWKVEKIGGRHMLSMAVLRETFSTETPDGFGTEEKPQYRVLRLSENGGDRLYTQEVWREHEKENSKEKEWYLHVEPFAPVDAAGRSWQEIPFCFVGAKNNDAIPDKAPLYDIAELNIGHFRNSAEYEDTCFMCGQVQPVMSGVERDWVEYLEEKGFQIGSRVVLPLPIGASFSYEQAAPNPIPAEAMKTKEAQMVALGAQLLTAGQTTKTATEADADNSRNTSVLALVASNVSEAYTRCLNWIGRFMGADHEYLYTITQDFTRYSLQPQLITALVQLWQTGKYPDSDLWEQLRKYGLINSERQDEEIKDELETSGEGLGLGGEGEDA